MTDSKQSAVLLLTTKQEEILNQISNSGTTAQNIAHRASIILSLANGTAKKKAARELCTDKNTVKKWCNRWLAACPKLAEIEYMGTPNRKYKEDILEILKDAPRSGAPPRFTAEQVAHIVSIGCEVLDDSDKPISRWTHKEIVREAIKRKIVTTISPSSVGRFFKRCPHKTS